MKKFFSSTLFQSVTGDVSMKRVLAFIYSMSALLMVFVSMFTKFEVSYDLLIVVVGYAGSLMGVSVLEYFGKVKKPELNNSEPYKPEKEGDLLVD